MAAILVSTMLLFDRSVHVYHTDSFAASIGTVTDLRMEGVSLLCDGFEQLQESGLSMATEVVEVYQWHEAMLFGGEFDPLETQGYPNCFEQLL